MSNFGEDLFDPNLLISDLIKTDLDLNVFNDDKEDTQVFPVASNFFEFVTTPDVYLNTSLFPRQLQWGINLFEDYCPYCSDVAFAREGLFNQSNEEIASRITFYEFGKCPKCSKTRKDATDTGHFKNTDELAICAGMRGGKTVFSAVVANYILHRYLMLKPNPSSYFGRDKMIQNQELHITFCAVQLAQAYDTLWRQFITIYENSPWFIKYEKHLRLLEKKNNEGEKFYTKKDSPTDPVLKFYIQNIEVTCETPNIKAIRGRTRIFTAIDEIGWMDTDIENTKGVAKVTASAAETYEALVKSLRTVRSASSLKKENGFYDAPTGIACNISSPSSVHDMIMHLVKEPLPGRLSYHYATWEVNPFIDERSCRVDSNNENAFLRDYQATPPFANNPYFSNALILEQSINTEYRQQSLINWSFEKFTDRYLFDYIYMKIDPIKPEKIIPRLLTVDTGYTNDSFAICMSHYDSHENKILCDVLLEISPQFPENKGCNINFPDMYKHAIEPLLKNFNVQNVIYDRWNSLDMVHRIRKDYTMAEQYSLKWTDFIKIRNNLYEGKFKFPLAEMAIEKFQRSKITHWELVVNKPIIHTLVQCLTIREVGKKIIKPILGTDDLWRSIALAMWFFEDPANCTTYSNYSLGNSNQMRNSNKNLAVALSYYNKGSQLPTASRFGSKVSRVRPF